MRTGAVIAAAGLSSRMGSFKPMLPVGPVSIAQKIIANFRQAGVSPIVVVTGFRAAELEAHLSEEDVVFVRNPEYRSTAMLDSAKLGFERIRGECDRTFFTPVDIPLFTLDTVRKLMDSGAHVVKPVCGGTEGHPILLSSEILSRILSFSGDGGLRGAIAAVCTDCDLVDVTDSGILQDADTPEDYRELLDRMKTDRLLSENESGRHGA